MTQDLTASLSSLDPPSIPFTIEAYEGFGQTEGIIRFQKPNLILEFNTKDTFVGLLKSGIKKIVIGLPSVESFEYKSNFFRTKLTLRTNSLHLLENLPGSKHGVAKLTVKRSHKAEAASLTSFIALQLSEYRLRLLEDEMDRGSE